MELGDSSFKGRGAVNIKTLDYDAEVFRSNIHSKDFPFLSVLRVCSKHYFLIVERVRTVINCNTDIWVC